MLIVNLLFSQSPLKPRLFQLDPFWLSFAAGVELIDWCLQMNWCRSPSRLWMLRDIHVSLLHFGSVSVKSLNYCVWLKAFSLLILPRWNDSRVLCCFVVMIGTCSLLIVLGLVWCGLNFDHVFRLLCLFFSSYVSFDHVFCLLYLFLSHVSLIMCFICCVCFRCDRLRHSSDLFRLSRVHLIGMVNTNFVLVPIH